MGQIYLNGETYGGGGGGSVAYGYENPESIASDGAMYLLLNSSNKLKGTFLYIEDEWVLVDGDAAFAYDLALLDSLAQRNKTTGATVYTAENGGMILAINFNLNGEASTKSLTSPITTDGTVISSQTISASWSSPNRNQSSTMSLLEVAAGDDVTLDNAIDSGNYTTQLHALFDVRGISNDKSLAIKQYEAKYDSSMGQSKTVTLSNGVYIIVVFETSGEGATDMGCDISADTKDKVIQTIFSSGVFAAKIMLIDLSNISANIDLSWLDKSNYVSRGYSIFKIFDPSAEYVLYDNGTEEVTWTVSGGTKNADNIQVNTGGGTFTNYAVTDDAIDVTGYSILHVECYYRSQSYNLDFDISAQTGSKYISFTYLTDSSHNECAVGLSDTKTGATTFRVDSRNGGDGVQKMFYMSLS